jgi:transcriptional regulator with XRE-family HTH domain
VASDTKGVLRDLGLRLGELRRAQGLTQEELSERLEMLAPNYARIEQGRMNVTVDTLVRIAKVLKVGLADLFAKPKTRKASLGRPRKSQG